MPEITFMLRQGDVLLIQVGTLPPSCREVPTSNDHIILARGEVTGHCHYVSSLEAAMLEANEAMRATASEVGVTDPRAVVGGLRVNAATTLWHGTPVQDPAGPRDADHAPLALPVGNYLVLQPREFDDADDFRRVAD